jgi:hypothetical protein
MTDYPFNHAKIVTETAQISTAYGPNENRYIKAARRMHHRDGEIEVDDWPLISPSDDGGAYVQAWVWVSDDDLAALDLLTNGGNTANHE